MTSSLLPILPAVYDVLFNFSQSDGFWANLETAFGTSYDVVKATELRQQWQSRDFSQIPPIEVLSDEVLGTANGAYSSSTNKIYLSASFLNTASSAAIINVILEEIGHYVDAQINQVDSAGDEGAIFAELVQGNSLDVATLDALRAENDQTTIIVNGEIIQVEQADFTGTNGNDSITGTSTSDNIFGLDGNDTLSGLGGNDNIYGGNGNDVVNGDTGNDDLAGDNGNDSLNGGVGSDLLRSDLGNDTINGGSGFDSYFASYSDRSSGLTMTYDPTTGNGTITIGSEVDTLISIESFNAGRALSGGFEGTDFNDFIVGTSDNENYFWYGLFGNGGDDTVSGGAGDDKVFGGEGNDVVNGDTGNDELYGQNNNDTLQGTNNGTGERDYLEGGTGADRFVLGNTGWSGYDDGIVGDGTSSEPNEYGIGDYAAIADFNSGEGDIIQLQGVSADYNLVVLGTDTGILKVKPGTEADELIAIIRSRTGLSLTASYFNYVSSPILPSLSINNLTVVEGLNTNAVLTVNLNNPSSQAITVNYTTTPVTATANSDYTSTTGGVKRKNLKRTIQLQSNVADPTQAGPINAMLKNKIDDFKNKVRIPEDVTIRQSGQSEQEAETNAFLGTALIIAIGLIFLILVLQFNSISKPFIVITEIFFSVIGVLLGYAITGKVIATIMLGVGIIGLAGIVIKNGILLIEFTDELRHRGYKTREAAIQAGKIRIIPVLLTALATMLGLLPLAVGFNIDFVSLFQHLDPKIFFGGDSVVFWGPLSWTIIYGLVFAFFLTLMMVPSMYIISERLRRPMERFYGTKFIALLGFLGPFFFIFVGFMYLGRRLQGKKVWVGQQRKTVPSKI